LENIATSGRAMVPGKLNTATKADIRKMEGFGQLSCQLTCKKIGHYSPKSQVFLKNTRREHPKAGSAYLSSAINPDCSPRFKTQR
jgi:hypothetical protein